MISRKIPLLLFILLCLPALACGLFGSDATATPVPPTAPPATTPPEATATLMPTEAPPTEPPPPTEAPPPDVDLTTYVSESNGVTVQYPVDWAVEDFLFLVIASEEGLLAETSSPDEGGVVVIIGNAAEDMPSGTPEEILESSLADLDMGDVAIVDGPDATQIQGQDAAVARIAGDADDGTPLEGLVAIITNEDRVVLAMAVSPSDSSDEYLPTLEAIVNSIEVGQPTAEFDFDDTFGDTEPAGELVLLAPGDMLAQSIPDDTYREYSFQGIAGESDIFVVNTVSEDFDVVLELYAAGAPDDLLADIDEGFSGEPEVLDFTPEADGEYILRVRPFGITAGDYDIYMLEPAAESRFEGFTLDNASTTTRVCVPAGEALIAVVIPEEDFDPVVNVSGPDGDTIFEFNLDSGASGDPEVLIFDGLATGDAPYPVIVVVSGFAGQAGNYVLLLGPTGAVVDGC